LWAIKTVDAVDQAGLASAIGTNDRKYFAALYLKINIVQGMNTAKTEGNVLDVQLNIAALSQSAPAAI
jgi:hypothetical protein